MSDEAAKVVDLWSLKPYTAAAETNGVQVVIDNFRHLHSQNAYKHVLIAAIDHNGDTKFFHSRMDMKTAVFLVESQKRSLWDEPEAKPCPGDTTDAAG